MNCAYCMKQHAEPTHDNAPDQMMSIRQNAENINLFLCSACGGFNMIENDGQLYLRRLTSEERVLMLGTPSIVEVWHAWKRGELGS